MSAPADSPEDPPGFIVGEALGKAAYDSGFRLPRGAHGPWLGYASTTASGEVWLAGRPPAGPWWLAVSLPGVAAALGSAIPMPGPGHARFTVATLPALHDALDRAWRLSCSLPTAPLAAFRQQTAGLPRRTEAGRLTVQRIGQDVFRQALLDYWGGRCPLTGITDPALLRASHIVRWADCRDDAQRLDVGNGLLLSALWDAAFDAGLTSFADDGTPLLAFGLSAAALAALGSPAPPELLPGHRANLREHRARHGFPSANAGPQSGEAQALREGTVGPGTGSHPE